MNLRSGLSLAAVGMLLLAGCQKHPELATVEGVLTVDGQPLPSAVVVFTPVGAPASRGVTGSDGRYELTYAGDRRGARIGTHQVLVFAGAEEGAIGPLHRYRSGNELTAEVKSGHNTCDFALSTQP